LGSSRRPWTSVPRFATDRRPQHDQAGVPEEVAMQSSGHKTASMLWRYNITDTRDIKEAGKRAGSYFKVRKEGSTCGKTYGVPWYQGELSGARGGT
jgi:hypothetical protein